VRRVDERRCALDEGGEGRLVAAAAVDVGERLPDDARARLCGGERLVDAGGALEIVERASGEGGDVELESASLRRRGALRGALEEGGGFGDIPRDLADLA
jgi:hypothetical protein